MFKNNKSRKVIVSTLVVLMLISTVAFAAEVFEKKVTTTQGRIKLSYDGKDVTKEVQNKYGTPAFTVKDYDSRAYVPVRALAEVMGIDVDYNHKTDVANFTDNEKKLLKEKLASAEAEKATLKAKLATVEAENKNLKEKLEEKVDTKTDLKELEKKLNKDFGLVDNVSFNIVLKESKDTITANIYVDLRNSTERSDWRGMSVRSKRDLIQYVSDDILKVFPKYKIDGSIYDNYDRYNLYLFNVDSNGRLTITDREFSGGQRDDLLYEADYYLDLNLRKLAPISKIDIREGRKGEVYGTVTLKNSSKSIRDVDLDDALYYAEKDLIDIFGKDTYLDIKIYQENNYLGRYVDGKWSNK